MISIQQMLTLRIMVIDQYLDEEKLYKKGFDGTLLSCLDERKTKKKMKEVYEGVLHYTC